MSEKKQDQEIQIELTPEKADGVYSNLAVINHSPSEFVIDFIQMMPGVPKAQVKSRIIISPQHAKRLLGALNDNIKRYEASHGTVTELEQQSIPIGFGGPTGEAWSQSLHETNKPPFQGGLFYAVKSLSVFKNSTENGLDSTEGNYNARCHG